MSEVISQQDDELGKGQEPPRGYAQLSSYCMHRPEPIQGPSGLSTYPLKTMSGAKALDDFMKQTEIGSKDLAQSCGHYAGRGATTAQVDLYTAGMETGATARLTRKVEFSFVTGI